MSLVPQISQVPVFGPNGSLLHTSAVHCWPGQGMVVTDAAFTPIAALHGAYARKGILPLQLAQTVGNSLFSQKVSPGDITDFALASSVPHTGTTFLATSVRNTLGLENVAHPLHVNTLCTGGATALHAVIADLARRDGKGVGLAMGADDQSVGLLAFSKNQEFRTILEQVTGRPFPMRFELGEEGQGISPEKFSEAVTAYIKKYGAVPGSVSDAILDSFWDTSLSTKANMWDTAGNVAKLFGFTTPDAVRIAMESHRRATLAMDQGVFEGLMITVPGSGLETHENPQRDPDAFRLGRGETAPGVTPQTSSKMGGAAAAVVIMSAGEAWERELSALAEIVGYSFSHEAPETMGLGPISASRGLLQYLGLEMKDMGHIEINEAFAAVVGAFLRQPDFGLIHGAGEFFYPPHMNPWGGAIAIGHVMGAKFLELVALGTRWFELHHDSEYCLCTLCGGGGQGAAMILRNPRFMKGQRFIKKELVIDPMSDAGRMDALASQGLEWKTGGVERALLDSLLTKGYLSVNSLYQAIDKACLEAVRLGRTLPTPEDIDYVLARERGSLPASELLRKATEVATIRSAVPGSSVTIGKTIGVVGAGEMGYQLALDYARAGYEVYLSDMNYDLAEKGRQNIVDTLYKALQRGLNTAEEAAQIFARIHIPEDGLMTTAIKKVTGTPSPLVGEGGGEGEKSFEMIVEAATENVGVKNKIFKGLREALGGANTILATNTSSISAEAAGADAVVHYFNPLYAMALVDGSFSPSLGAEKRADYKKRIAAIAANQRKEYYPTNADSPGSLVNPFFVATYFTAGMLESVAVDINGWAVMQLEKGGSLDGDRELLEDMRDDPRKYSTALLDALSVEAGAATNEPIKRVLEKRLDVSQNSKVGALLRRGSQGLFRLVDSTGGPHTAVECANNIAKFYGDHFQAPVSLVMQDADWQKGRRWTWYPEGLDNFGYDSAVREKVGAMQRLLGDDLVEPIRKRVHERYWSRVMNVMGTMFDKGVLTPDEAYYPGNGTGLGLGWRASPMDWLRTQGDMDGVKKMMEGEGIPVPKFLADIREVSELPKTPGVLLKIEGGVATITMNRPAKRNAVDQGMVSELFEIAQKVAADPSVHSVILAGAGKNFVAGADLLWFHERQQNAKRIYEGVAEEHKQVLAEIKQIEDELRAAQDALAVALGDRPLGSESVELENVRRLSRMLVYARGNADAIIKPVQDELAKTYDEFSKYEIGAMKMLRDGGRLVISVTEGTNMGGGAEMTAQADYAIALEGLEGETAQYSFPEAFWGIGVGYGGHVELTRRMGKGLALRYLATGAKFGSNEAVQTGYLNLVVRRDRMSKFLKETSAAWKNMRAGGMTKERFIFYWTSDPRPESRYKSEQVKNIEKLWNDPFAVEAMILGQVPPWLTGEERKLAEKEVRMIRKGSPEAVRLLYQMVEQGEKADLRAGLTHIFGTPDANMAIGSFAGANKRTAFTWPADVQDKMDDIVKRRKQ